LGQKTNPLGFRLGVTRGWDSNWYDDQGFAAKLQEDLMVRNYIRSRLKRAGISRIQIDRTPKRAVITIHTSRPGIVIGKSGKAIASQLEGRISFRRAMKQSITQAMRMGAEGIRVMCAGRLGGAEIARTEHYKDGRIPLQTIRADIDYATATARTIYGAIGVKVWICKGEILGGMNKEKGS
jgi:small subunit ribosomal protein S3